MKYDPNTSNVDRWHGMTAEDLARGYKSVEQNSPDDTNNYKQLNGGTMPADNDLNEQSD